MNKIKYLAIILILIFIISLLVIVCTKKSDKNILESLISDEGYIFEDLFWFCSLEDVLKNKNFSEEDIEINGNKSVIKIMKRRQFDKPNISPYVILQFSNNKFVAATYSIEFTEKENFISCTREFKNILKELGKPDSSNLDVLDSIPSIQGESVYWNGNDNSRIEIDIYNNTSSIEHPYYIINLKVAAPKMAPNKLR